MSILDLFGGNTAEEDRMRRKSVEEIVSGARDIKDPIFEALSPTEYQYLGDLVLSGKISAPQIAAPDELRVGEIDPRLAGTYTVEDSPFQDLEGDPRLKERQIAALAGLEEITQGGGMTLADEAALARIQAQSAQADRGRREAILQASRQRGQSGSGMELLAQLQSAQEATNQASQQGLDIAGMAQKRALDALMAGGQMAGDIRGQGFSEQAQRAQALDAIARFNAQNMQQGSQFNVTAQNQAQQQNIANQMAAGQFNIGQTQAQRQQNVANQLAAQQFNAQAQNQAAMQNWQQRQQQQNMTTQSVNEAQQFNRFNIPQQQFQNQLSKQGAMSGALQAQADMYSELAARKKQEAGEMFQGAMKIGAGVATGGASLAVPGGMP